MQRDRLVGFQTGPECTLRAGCTSSIHPILRHSTALAGRIRNGTETRAWPMPFFRPSPTWKISEHFISNFNSVRSHFESVRTNSVQLNSVKSKGTYVRGQIRSGPKSWSRSKLMERDMRDMLQGPDCGVGRISNWTVGFTTCAAKSDGREERLPYAGPIGALSTKTRPGPT